MKTLTTTEKATHIQYLSNIEDNKGQSRCLFGPPDRTQTDARGIWNILASKQTSLSQVSGNMRSIL